MKKKTCLKCKWEKDESQFHKFGNGQTTAYCKTCIKRTLSGKFNPDRFDKIIRREPRPWQSGE